ncbi:hypothetical protein BDY24DRAFT_385854 [Mrakia frigida]|uniref:uncharacterized protein n=1 Tax=Mrakia frigida TaxID=29902 RepID=UPI003FCC039E
MVLSSSLLFLASLALSPIALARPTTLSLFKRQTSTIPEACSFTCAPVQTALSTCLVSTCLCTEDILDSFVDCSECTLLATQPADLNSSIASYQLAIDAYRQTCAATSPAVILPNVSVSAPAANATYATASTNSSSSSSASATLSSNSSSTSSVLSTSSASAVSASMTSTPSASGSSTGVGGAGASASASASASSTGGASSRVGGGLGTVLGAAVLMGLVVSI